MSPIGHIGLMVPLDFDRRPEVRVFARKLAGAEPGIDAERACWMALKCWFDWGVARTDWRPLKVAPPVGQPWDWREHVWIKEDLTHILEGFCGWNGEPGALICAGLEAGVFAIEERGEQRGLVLAGFFPMNAHLSPDYKTIQQRGGMARANKAQREADERAAREQQEILARQGYLPFGETKISVEVQRACFALVMRMDRACGCAVRQAETYTVTLLQAAKEVVLGCSAEEIDAVEAYLVANRDNPKVVRVPDRVISNFREYLRNAESGNRKPERR